MKFRREVGWDLDAILHHIVLLNGKDVLDVSADLGFALLAFRILRAKALPFGFLRWTSDVCPLSPWLPHFSASDRPSPHPVCQESPEDHGSCAVSCGRDLTQSNINYYNRVLSLERCSTLSFGSGPLCQRSSKPTGPSALKHKIQSLNICRPTPPARHYACGAGVGPFPSCTWRAKMSRIRCSETRWR